MFKSLPLLYKACLKKICQLVISLMALLICVLSVHSFPEPLWVKDLCDSGTPPFWIPQNALVTPVHWKDGSREAQQDGDLSKVTQVVNSRANSVTCFSMFFLFLDEKDYQWEL
jgi:hypothetical protein